MWRNVWPTLKLGWAEGWTLFDHLLCLNSTFSPSLSCDVKKSPSTCLSPSLPCRLQTRRVLNIDGPHREAQAVGVSVTPGDVEHRRDTWDMFESALCFYKQQNDSLFSPFFIIRCWFLSPGASSRCAFDHRVYFCFLLLPWNKRAQRRRFCYIWAPGRRDSSLISQEIQMARSFERLTNGFSFAR